MPESQTNSRSGSFKDKVMRLSQRFSRKRLMQRGSGSSYSSISSEKRDAGTASTSGRPLLPAHAGDISVNGLASPRRIHYSHAAYQARDPYADAQILTVDSSHIFAAVLSSRAAALGDQYLRRNFHKELLQQIKVQSGDIRKAFKVSMANMDAAFRAQHPFNNHILDGVHLVAAYVDLVSNTLYLAGNGACGCIVGRTDPQGQVEVVTEVGLLRQQSRDLGNAAITTVQLTESINTILLGSEGYWREIAPHKALLRLQHYHDSTPGASEGNPSAHLVNHALHAVTQRTRRQADPRMRSLRSVTHLQSLWKGDKSNFKWGGRQPLRRRAGDVHGDISVIALRLDWQGSSSSSGSPRVRPSVSKRLRAGLSKLAASSSTQNIAAVQMRAAQHWDLLRMHFLQYPLESRQHTRQMWYDSVQLALSQHQQAQTAGAAEMLKQSLSPAPVSSSRVPAVAHAPPTSPLVKAC